MQFIYPATLTPDPTGGFVVTFRDWPEAITQGESPDEALLEAADCLEEAVAARIDDRDEIPAASAPLPDEHPVAVPIQTALKAALFLAMRETGVGPTELARRLGIHEKAARRLVDPRHASKAATLEQALLTVGRRLAIAIEKAA
ncbi:MAG: type II toxin-antitoxin system HicB family antitoxin [Thiohalocapsa sp.]|jgi:antitoxin HicB|uniref:type II toxin-antitoxin system HicB family antitoxin n=1 Tax=Thiohalocapsa sp. TaxID=2497641 RepID=UPI0025CD5AE8|nr:type II toxin-antitoxin system HicB family antitoxin [Thiohalocapsa sp.]MCG6941646.1 type II toxin-antitoxin system HicB family antitoxin [Thiohalocapsa sp.]